MSSIARKIAKAAAKRKSEQRHLVESPIRTRHSGLTQSFADRSDLRAAMYGSRHNPELMDLSLAGSAAKDRHDASERAAQMLTDAMDRTHMKWGEPGLSYGYTTGEQPDGSYITPEGVRMSKAYRDNLQTNKPDGPAKGEKGGNCNRSACQAPGAYWYNHSTRLYYCETCAEILNKDKFNREDAQRMYGHPLCTLDPDFASKA